MAQFSTGVFPAQLQLHTEPQDASYNGFKQHSRQKMVEQTVP
jgi:hypothetical protein